MLESNNWNGVEREDGTLVSENIEGAGPITLTFTEPGTYNITAYAKMRGAADSEKETFTYTVPEPSSVTITIPDLGNVTLDARVSGDTVTITGELPEGATVTRAYIHGFSLEEAEESVEANSFKLKQGTPPGTYPLTVVIKYEGIAYSAVINIEVK